ncbi:bile acid:sodium symporter family protein [Psychrobacillus sp. MER TA 171]|uniref:bile acid:sodium symporter family protein n=1 Tax=Psychrobacillus sp. MER TA 171 TaxID=2939577 RepID=UPI0020406ABC|nr:bile acid:sodium symporter family protein [Psychrobacillus sp. MER TA 171]MCM3356646.1 bile acid:sodium symporter family protein [Psychrobacillus sp. MER TA 171]
MMLTINKFLEKTMAYFIPVSVVIGVLVSDYIVDFAWLIPWIFAFMTFAGSLNSNFASFKDAVLHPLPIFVTFTILHIIMPLLSLGIGYLVFPGEMLTITGLVLAMSIPTGITSFVWVAVAKGNNVLALTIILLGALLSPVIVPLTLHLLVGETVEIDALGMMIGLLWTIVIPSIVGMILNQVTKGKVVDILSARLSPFSKVGMGIVVMLNGAVVAPFLLERGFALVGLGIVVIIIAFLGYVLSFSAGRLLKQEKETVIAMVFTGGMRNISAGVVLATAYFPPAVAIPVVLGMLFQQVLASLFNSFIERHYRKM